MKEKEGRRGSRSRMMRAWGGVSKRKKDRGRARGGVCEREKEWETERRRRSKGDKESKKSRV